LLKYQIKYFLSLFLILFAFSSFAYDMPKPVGFVNDFAHIMNDKTIKELTALSSELEQKTGVELVVVTVNSVGKNDIFDYSVEMFQKWGIGKKGKDNGILFLISKNDRKLRIDTGYGVEGILPDGLLGRIRDKYIIPYFKKGDYDSGILNGSIAIATTVAKSKGVTLNGKFQARRAKRKAFSLMDLILVIAVLIFFVPYIFPIIFGAMFGSYRSDWDNSLGGGFGDGFGGGFGGFGGGSTGGGGVGGSW